MPSPGERLLPEVVERIKGRLTRGVTTEDELLAWYSHVLREELEAFDEEAVLPEVEDVIGVIQSQHQHIFEAPPYQRMQLVIILAVRRVMARVDSEAYELALARLDGRPLADVTAKARQLEEILVKVQGLMEEYGVPASALEWGDVRLDLAFATSPQGVEVTSRRVGRLISNQVPG